jgi:outer membrane protein OmpA-like peptidoglycan-associated protein
VILFGAVVGVLRMADEPRLQPVAFVLKEGDQYSAVEGVYVGQSDGRLWYASIALANCTGNTARRGSGRLRSVPSKQVSLLTIGPEMGVPKLAREARAMRDAIQAEFGGHIPAAGPAAVRDSVPLQHVSRARVGQSRWVTLSDEDLGKHPTLTLNGRRLRMRQAGYTGPWQIRLPREAGSGAVYADCGEPVNSAFLTVPQRPLAVATATAVNPAMWRLDARGSMDPDGQIDRYTWIVDNQPVSHRRRTVSVVPAGTSAARLVIRDNQDTDSADVGDRRLMASRVLPLIGHFVRVYPSDLLFRFDHRRLTAAGRRRIRALRAEVSDAELVRVQVHTDTRGSTGHNKALSRAQAGAIDAVLLGGLVPADNRDVCGEGERGQEVQGRHRQNRRVVIIVFRQPTEKEGCEP